MFTRFLLLLCLLTMPMACAQSRASHHDPCWSPDGRFIAWLADVYETREEQIVHARQEVRLANPQGEALRSHPFDTNSLLSLQGFSADGRTIQVAETTFEPRVTTVLWDVPVADGKPRARFRTGGILLGMSGTEPVMGEATAPRFDFATVRKGGRRVALRSRAAALSAHSVSPGGRYIVARAPQRDLYRIIDTSNGEVWDVSAAGSRLSGSGRKVSETHVWQAVWRSPVKVWLTRGYGSVEVVEADVQRRTVTSVMRGRFDTAIAPGPGGRLAYTAADTVMLRGGRRLLRNDHEAEIQLTPAGWEPGGASLLAAVHEGIVFAASGPVRQWHLYRIFMDQRPPVRLTAVDGPLTEGKPEAEAATIWGQTVGTSDAIWGDDGSSIAVLRPVYRYWMPERVIESIHDELWLVPPGGGTSRRLYIFARRSGTSPRLLSFKANKIHVLAGGTLFRIPLDGGRPSTAPAARDAVATRDGYTIRGRLFKADGAPRAWHLIQPDRFLYRRGGGWWTADLRNGRTRPLFPDFSGVLSIHHGLQRIARVQDSDILVSDIEGKTLHTMALSAVNLLGPQEGSRIATGGWSANGQALLMLQVEDNLGLFKEGLPLANLYQVGLDGNRHRLTEILQSEEPVPEAPTR